MSRAFRLIGGDPAQSNNIGALMANATKTRGGQTIRTDRTIGGQVTFYDARIEDVALARIGILKVASIQGMADVVDLIPAHVIRATLHGYTQNILDSSNKLDGDARVDFVRKAVALIHAGGWASAPQDEAKTLRDALDGMRKMQAIMPNPAMAAMIADYEAKIAAL